MTRLEDGLYVSDLDNLSARILVGNHAGWEVLVIGNKLYLKRK